MEWKYPEDIPVNLWDFNILKGLKEIEKSVL